MNRLYKCCTCDKESTASEWNSNTDNCFWGDQFGFTPIEDASELIVMYYSCPKCKNRINNKNIRRIEIKDAE